MRVLIAPQEFKGSLAARAVAEAIARGISAAYPDAELDLLPMSDGGPGFLEALHVAMPASERVSVPARDPLRRPVDASILHSGDTVFIEAAGANGLWRLAPAELDPLYAGTEGVGDLLLAAAALEPRRIVIGVGGSATNDGGAGMARTLGARFYGMDGGELPPGAAPLAEAVRIDWDPPAAFQGIEITVASDVQNPLVGDEGAATVYGPQKGATPPQVDQLDAALFRYATAIRRSLGVDVATMPGAGAAGGLGAGLVAFLGAQIVSGFEVVAEAIGLRERIDKADLVITGEGSYDAQSAMGKVTGRIAGLASDQGRDVIILAGRATTTRQDVVELVSYAADEEESIASAARLLERAAADAIARR